jgi:hypothetical protein
MPGDFRDPKRLPQWVELDYYRRQRPLRRWVRRLSVGVLLAGTVAAGAFALTPWAPRTYQAGPLSSAHALFSNDCHQCHTEPLQVVQRFWPANASAATVTDAACSKCHDGPAHHPDETHAGESRHCSHCHHEHHGPQALVADNECTTCHADLRRHSRRGDNCPYGNVISLPAGHPPFDLRPEKGHPSTAGGKDKRQLFFNHQVHLQGPKVHKKDPAAPGGERALRCGDCHQSDAAGQYMLPVRYESHCKDCHPLTVQLAGAFTGEQARRAERAFAQDPLPHPAPGQGPEVVRAALRDRLMRLVHDYPGLVGSPTPADDRGVPGPPGERDVGEREWRWVDEKAGEAERLVFWNAQAPRVEEQLFAHSGGCRYCHVAQQPQRAGELPVFEKPNMPARWLVRSHFSHERHRMMDCQECHRQAGRDAPAGEVLALPGKEMMLPGKDLCARCHAPGANGGPGARHDCVECHQYHPRTGTDTHQGRPLGELLQK